MMARPAPVAKDRQENTKEPLWVAAACSRVVQAASKRA